jgi:hypothetical protein
MKTLTEKFEEYKAILFFINPDENLKGWINETNFENHYVKDWNELMEVVQRINITEDYRFSIQINTMDTYVHDAKNNNYIFQSDADWQPNELKESVYEAVIYFIKWYNNQKN